METGISGDCFVQTSTGPCRVRDLVDKPCKLWFDGTIHEVKWGFTDINSTNRVSVSIKGGSIHVMDGEQRVAIFSKGDNEILFVRASDLQNGDKLLFPVQNLQQYKREGQQKQADFASLRADEYMKYLEGVDSGEFRMNLSTMLTFVDIAKQDDDTGNSQLEIAIQSLQEAFFLQTFLGFFGVLGKIVRNEDDTEIYIVVQNQYATEYIKLCNLEYMKTMLDPAMKVQCRDIVKNQIMLESNYTVVDCVKPLIEEGVLYYPQVESDCSYIIGGGIILQAKVAI